ncbi:hypothetical protein Q1695_004326 [Nippostrongylus brasiliensis]|nr:hypothetical protein Q1695_004326 [Nippostrongylus brasiliensis]
MRTELSVSLEGTMKPEISPRVDRPPTSDPHYGFDKPRKVREMKVSWEEMDQFKLKQGPARLLSPSLDPAPKVPASNYAHTSRAHLWYFMLECDQHARKWFPFMSVESCSRRMVDAILKEKRLSVNAARSLREYLGIDYNPNGGIEFSHKRKTLPSDEYFQSPHFVWWLIVFAFFLMLGILSSPYYSNSLSAFEMLLRTIVRQYTLTVVVLSCIIVCLHFVEGIYTLLLCDELRFSFACAAKWFLQTACIGYPSLKILMAHVHKTRKQQ